MNLRYGWYFYYSLIIKEFHVVTCFLWGLEIFQKLRTKPGKSPLGRCFYRFCQELELTGNIVVKRFGTKGFSKKENHCNESGRIWGVAKNWRRECQPSWETFSPQKSLQTFANQEIFPDLAFFHIGASACSKRHLLVFSSLKTPPNGTLFFQLPNRESIPFRCHSVPFFSFDHQKPTYCINKHVTRKYPDHVFVPPNVAEWFWKSNKIGVLREIFSTQFFVAAGKQFIIFQVPLSSRQPVNQCPYKHFQDILSDNAHTYSR